VQIPTNPDCMCNYSFCELIDLGVEIDDDWYSVGNIEYDALDDLQNDFPQLFEGDLVLAADWDEITHKPTKRYHYEAMDLR
jgi:hypothetical protein